jgi:hypothetical protein
VRPKSIIYFERAYFSAMALGFVDDAVTWNESIESIEATPGFNQIAVEYLIGSITFFALINLLLWFFVARRANVVAKWFVVAFAAFNILGLGALVIAGDIVANLDEIPLMAAVVLSLLGAWFLFRPDANLWFRGRWTGNYPDIFR